ncbi:MAG: hypothetical protein V1924_00855 [Candidatus Bathyarchaeota archaeon]
MSKRLRKPNAEGGRLLIVVALLHDSRVESRLEGHIRSYAKIRQRLYLDEPDKNGLPRTRVAVYVIEAMDPRLLRSSLKALENSRDLEVIIR